MSGSRRRCERQLSKLIGFRSQNLLQPREKKKKIHLGTTAVVYRYGDRWPNITHIEKSVLKLIY